MVGRTSIRSLALLALLVALALFTAGDLPSLGGEDPSPSRVVVGDLKLADDDEDRSDGVEATFVSDNLAPGDRYRARLTLVRESPDQAPPAAEPRVTIRFEPNSTTDELARALDITEIAYGDRDLDGEARRRCGAELTLARLADCTRTSENPLANLSDPTPVGRHFELGLRFDEAATSALEDERFRFEVHVELHGRVPQDVSSPSPVDASTEPPAIGSCGSERSSVGGGSMVAPPVGDGFRGEPPASTAEELPLRLPVLLEAHLPEAC